MVKNEVALVELNPVFVGAGGPGISNRRGNLVEERHGVGLSFDCPCGCKARVYVPFTNPLDGKAPVFAEYPTWERTGKTLRNLSLTPSILRSAPYGCGWHGYVTDGKVLTI